MKQLAFFMNPSCPSWKIISLLLDQIFNANHLIFTGYGISTLMPLLPANINSTLNFSHTTLLPRGLYPTCQPHAAWVFKPCFPRTCMPRLQPQIYEGARLAVRGATTGLGRFLVSD